MATPHPIVRMGVRMGSRPASGGGGHSTTTARTPCCISGGPLRLLTKDGFYHTLDAYTEDNECLVIDTSPENHVTPNEMMRWWKAIDPGEFQMGSKEYWESAQNGGDDV